MMLTKTSVAVQYYPFTDRTWHTKGDLKQEVVEVSGLEILIIITTKRSHYSRVGTITDLSVKYTVLKYYRTRQNTELAAG